MKKLISLVLVLALALSVVSAIAEIASPTPQPIDLEETATETAGITVGEIPAESEALVNELTESQSLTLNFVDAQGAPTTPAFTEFQIVQMAPMPAIEVDNTLYTDGVDEAVAEFEVEIPAYIAEYVKSNLDNIVILFTYEVEDQLNTYEVDYEVVEDNGAYSIKYEIPVDILQAAEGCPSFISIALVK